MSRWVKGVLQLVSKFCWWLSPSKGFSGLIRKAGGGMETQEGGDICILKLIHVVVQQKPTQHCKAIILQLKINFKNRNLTKRLVFKTKQKKSSVGDGR